MVVAAQSGQAKRLFDTCPKWDVVSWTALIASYGQHGSLAEAESVFESACAHLDPACWNAMIVIFVQNGHLAKARGLFERMATRDSITWNAMVSAHAQNGHLDVAVEFLHGMCLEGRKLNPESFRCILVACSYGGNVGEAWKYFVSLRGDHAINPSKDHYCCMVDTLGRAGRLCEAQELICAMPYIADVEWASLLASCATYKDDYRAKQAANVLFKLQPEISAPYVTLSNVYCG
ncbi:hypothetical protein SELMODRAFT_126801 [Selaginella moellendorffii]|uniref:Pentacotripeptide-repeat region of PRORP domain-containing protein n=2 Tax=Selaginella moellendorffii TaxID=88036 RepID=D8SWW7_SELML|nr:hypothetical protein SELMODRAFT_126801 [Selaginella moellendorffii]